MSDPHKWSLLYYQQCSVLNVSLKLNILYHSGNVIARQKTIVMMKVLVYQVVDY